MKFFIKNLSKKDASIKYLMKRIFSNAKFSKYLGISESTISYYMNRPYAKEIKKSISKNY